MPVRPPHLSGLSGLSGLALLLLETWPPGAVATSAELSAAGVTLTTLRALQRRGVLVLVPGRRWRRRTVTSSLGTTWPSPPPESTAWRNSSSSPGAWWLSVVVQTQRPCSRVSPWSLPPSVAASGEGAMRHDAGLLDVATSRSLESGAPPATGPRLAVRGDGSR